MTPKSDSVKHHMMLLLFIYHGFYVVLVYYKKAIRFAKWIWKGFRC